MAKIYDSFLFFNELDLLDIRLTMLYPHVDYFVISECDYTFSGKEKPFYFEDNKEKFAKFSDKIIHIKHYKTNEHNDLSNFYGGNKKIVFDKLIKNYNLIKNTPETDNGKPHWCREYLQREYVGLGLSECNDDDIIIFSDLDEMPRPEIITDISKLNFKDNKYFLYSAGLQYYINNLSNTNWLGSVIASYGKIKDSSLNNLRKHRGNYTPIENGGWHLSFMGGVERIKMKLDSYGHQEYNNDAIKSNIETKLKQNTDVLGRSNYSSRPQIEQCFFENLSQFDINDYPNNIIELVKEKYPYLIK
jgi:beta-1,4-mannosyl-glycoprotein beta-1,4-N-acetylglucosaminyltransferase